MISTAFVDNVIKQHNGSGDGIVQACKALALDSSIYPSKEDYWDTVVPWMQEVCARHAAKMLDHYEDDDVRAFSHDFVWDMSSGLEGQDSLWRNAIWLTERTRIDIRYGALSIERMKTAKRVCAILECISTFLRNDMACGVGLVDELTQLGYPPNVEAHEQIVDLTKVINNTKDIDGKDME